MKFSHILAIVLFCLVYTKADAQKEALTQTLRGTVADKNLQTPLIGATIVIMNSDPIIGTVSDEDGKFRLEKVPVGRQELKISYLGYKEVILPNILMSSGKETVLAVAMEEDIQQSEAVTVIGKKEKGIANNALVVNSVTNLRTEEINRFAGSRQDPSRMAANYAGVAGGGDQRNDIIVRGNSPTGVLWRLEGVDIPNPNHFTFTGNTGGAFSVLNNNLLANSDFLTGAFPAEYGNKTAAVFDIKLRNGNNEKRENTIQIGLNGLELATEGPISKKNGSSYLLSYRYLSFSVLDKLGVSIGANGIPQFQDIAFKVNFPTQKAGTFTLWTIAGKSSIYLTDPEDTTFTKNQVNPVVQTTDDFASSMYASGLTHTYLFSENTSGKLTLSASGSKIGVVSRDYFQDKTERMEYDHQNKEGQLLINYTLTHKFNPRHLLKAGGIYRNISYNILEKYYSDKDSVFITGLDQKGNANLLQSFLHWRFNVTEKLSLNTGLYGQLFTLNNSYAIEPRFSANYTLSPKQRISFSAGLHSQTQSLFMYEYKFYHEDTRTYTQPNRNLDLMRSLHLVAGYNKSINSNLRFKTEVYYQHMYNVPVSRSTASFAKVYSVLNTGADYEFYTADSAVNTGTGKNYGIEFTLERYFHNNYYFLTNLSLLDSKFTGGDGIERNSAFDIGHVFNVLGGKEFHLDAQNRKTISVDIKMTHSGGRRIIGIDREASVVAGGARRDFAHAYDTKLKDYFRTDLKISYNVNRTKATHNFFVAADNVLNTQNVLTQDWDNINKKVVSYYQLGIFPYLGYKVQF